MTNVFDVCDLGAAGDGVTDSTAAFQRAIDLAGEVKGAVCVPPGKYICRTLRLRPSVCIFGFTGWGYRETGGSVISLGDTDSSSPCLFDLTGAHGARLRDLQLLGGHCVGERTHAVYVGWDERYTRQHDDPAREDNCLPEDCQIGFREDSVTVEGVHIKNFSGDAVHLREIWGFTVRNCMMVGNRGNAVYVDGWDGWICDCIMHTNHGAGIFADKICAALTLTGNRIEWNRNGGINLVNASSLNVTGNYFDRAFGPAITLRGVQFPCNNVTLTGNIFNRSGKYKPSFERDPYENSHLYFDNCQNIAVGGNTFLTGRDDFGESPFSPDYGIVMHRLCSCAFTGNTMYGGAMKEKIVDLGEHTGENTIYANAGVAPTTKDEKPGNGTYT